MAFKRRRSFRRRPGRTSFKRRSVGRKSNFRRSGKRRRSTSYTVSRGGIRL